MDNYVYGITALLPLAASMLVFQTNPYHALVIRGVLGAIAALVYAVLGAADVALTEALVGTLLAITLYAVAVRSSLVLRLGVLTADLMAVEQGADASQADQFKQRVDALRTRFNPYYLRVELVPYVSQVDLHQALMDKEIHATCTPASEQPDRTPHPVPSPYHLTTRLQRIHEILQTEPALPAILIEPTTPDAIEGHHP